MFGINGGEMIILVLVALFLIGPERVPEYAQKLKDLVKAGKRYATGATDDLKETLGPEFADVDRRKLDPRQYDPVPSCARPCWRTTTNQSLPRAVSRCARASLPGSRHPSTPSPPSSPSATRRRLVGYRVRFSTTDDLAGPQEFRTR